MPVSLRLIAGALLVLVGVTLLTVGVLGARSRLPRNRWVGIRTPATLRSEPAFTLAHRVGAVPAAAAGVVALVGGALLLAGSDAPALDWVLLAVSVLGSLGLAGFAGRVGDRAAARCRPTRRPPNRCRPAPASCLGCDLVAGCRDQQPAPVGRTPTSPAAP